MDTELATVGDVVASGYPDRLPGTSVVHAVRDNGQGMDADTLGKFFEPFFTTKGFDQGAGLGLATVHGIVRQNGGFIEVHSARGHGPVFHVYLPRHAETRADRDRFILAGGFRSLAGRSPFRRPQTTTTGS